MLRVDKDGVPCIVQRIYKEGDKFVVTFFDGGISHMPYTSDYHLSTIELIAEIGWLRRIHGKR
jgi:hypothetical protein